MELDWTLDMDLAKSNWTTFVGWNNINRRDSEDIIRTRQGKLACTLVWEKELDDVERK